MDTLIAIIRRKVNHKKFSEADRGHLHDQLMFNFKSRTSWKCIDFILRYFYFQWHHIYIYMIKILAIILFVVLMICFEIFVEYTEMISRKYRPILTFVNIFIRSDKLPILSSVENDLAKAKNIKDENKEKQDHYQRKENIRKG